MSAELLQSVGQSLYGLQWQTDLARDIGVSGRTVRHWVAGNTIPAVQWQKIARLCLVRTRELQKAVEAIGVAAVGI